MRLRSLVPVMAVLCTIAVACSSNNNNAANNANKPAATVAGTRAAATAGSPAATRAATGGTALPAGSPAATAARAGSPGAPAGGSPAAGAAKRPSGQPIRLGLIVALSGPSASVGDRGKKGADLAAELINADGGILGRPVEIVAVDSQAQATEGVKRIRELADKDIKLTFGYVSSAECLAVVPIAEQLGSLVVSSYCQDNSLVGEKFSKNFVRVVTDTEMLARAPALAMAKRFPNVKQWGTIAPDYVYGHGVEFTFVKQMQDALPGFQVVKEAFPPFQASNFQDYITSVASANPQGIMTALFAGDLLTMIKQAKPLNLFQPGRPFVLVGGDFDALLPLGKDIVEAWDSVSYYYKAFDNAMNKQFVDAYQKKYNTFPIGYDTSPFNTVYAFKAAIEKAKSTDPDKVGKAMEGLTFDSTEGPITIRPEDHQAVIDKIPVFHVVPAPDTPEGFKVTDIDFVNGKDVLSPPHPGKKGPYDQ